MIIYKVTNLKTGLSYIGQTVRDLPTRKSEHLRSAQRASSQENPQALHKAINEYGSGEFSWEIIETCTNKDQLNQKERYWVAFYNTLIPNGYNQTVGGAIDANMLEETRIKIADKIKELHKDPEYQARVYPKLKGLTPPNKGIPMTEKQRAKVSAARAAVYKDPTYVNPNVGQKRTEEQKANIKAGQKGKMAIGKAWTAAHKDQYTTEVRAKMRAKKLGKKPANTKKVRCIETGVIYDGLTEAAKALDINRQSIWMQIKGKLKSAGGKHFEYCS